MPGKVRRGDVVYLDPDSAVGTEMKKSRRCIVVQNDVANRVLSKTIIVPATGAKNVKKLFPVYVFVKKGDGGFTKDSVVECDQVRIVSEERIGRVLGRVSQPVLQAIGSALKITLGLD